MITSPDARWIRGGQRSENQQTADRFSRLNRNGAGAGVPSGPDGFTPAWLSGALGLEAPPSSIDITRVGVGFGLASEVYRVSWGHPGSEHDEGSDPCMARSVVIKLWATDRVAGAREVLFYRAFGDRVGIRTPRCHAAELDEEKQRGLLILEDIQNAEQGDCLMRLDLDRTVKLAREFARFHRTWWAHEEVSGAEWLPSLGHVERGLDWFELRRALFFDRFGDRLLPRCRQLLENVEAVEHRSNRLLAHRPETLLHVDLHLDNILFEENGTRPVVLDWARAARGPAAVDLCEIAFLIGPTGQAPAILDAYASELNREMTLCDRAALARALTGALLRRFISGTCGVALWNPASEREERMIDEQLDRVQDAVLNWTDQDPEGMML